MLSPLLIYLNMNSKSPDGGFSVSSGLGWNRATPRNLTLKEPMLPQPVACNGYKTTYIGLAWKLSSPQNFDSLQYRHQSGNGEKLVA